MKYFQFLIVITFVAAFINNSMSLLDIVLHAIVMIMMLQIIDSQPLFKHFGKYVVLLTFWISLMFMPAFHLVKNLAGEDGAFGYTITSLDYERILTFGARVLLLTCAMWLLLALFTSKRHDIEVEYAPTPISKRTVRLIFIIMFGLSLFSMAIGLSRMGTKGIELPFHLAGIITLIRIVFFPIFFTAIIENHILCKRKIPSKYYLWFFIWALLEVFVRLSKSAMLNSFMVLAIVMFLYYRPSKATLIRTVAPILGIFLLLYPIIDTMRSQKGASIAEDFVLASRQVGEAKSKENPLIQPINRTFMIPHMYAKDYAWVNHNQLFDFSLAPIILAWGGAARYQTFVIDGYPLEISHSSGTTALEDPLLFGGYGLCYIVIIILMVIGAVIDSMTYRRMWTIHVSLILFLWGFSNSQNITTLTDAVGLQYIFARFVAIWVAYRMNFKKNVIVPKYK